jgi:holin-like protein
VAKGKDGLTLKYINQFLIIMAVSFLGEILRYLIPLPVPAGIYGMILMFAGLFTGIIPLEKVERAADFLIDIMPLFFVPAGVGLMTKWVQLKTMLLPFLVAVFLITVIVMAVTGHVAQWLIRKNTKERGVSHE